MYAKTEFRDQILEDITELINNKLIECSSINPEDKMDISISTNDPYMFSLRIIKNCDIKSNLGSSESSGSYLYKPFPKANGIVLTFGIYNDKIMALPNAQSIIIDNKKYWIGYFLTLGDELKSKQDEIDQELKKCVELIVNKIK